MTFRAVFIGLVLSVGLACFGYVNDTWLFLSYIGGDLLPTHAYGLLLIGLLLVNPLLRLIRHFQFRASEFVVILSLSFMGSTLAGSAMFWQMPHPLITPIQEQERRPGWRQQDLLQYIPQVMMVEQVYRSYAQEHHIQRKEGESWQLAVERSAAEGQTSAADLKLLQRRQTEVLLNYMQGARQPGKGMINFTSVPWYAWRNTLMFWFAVLGLVSVGGICTVVIVHRQWAQREHLAYPIVTFANELIHHDGRGLFNPIFRNTPFWLGFAISFGILLINGYQKWQPDFVSIPLTVNLNPFRELQFVTQLMKVDLGRNILSVNFYFAAIGLAYFLTSEASFSLGISGWLYLLAAAPLVAAGVDMSRTLLGGGLPSNMYFGAYVGMAVMVLYLGRRFYWAALKRAFGLAGPRAGPREGSPDREESRLATAEVLNREVWAVRILLVVCALLVVIFWQIGLHPLLGIGFVVLVLMLFLMLARINVATGLFVIQPMWQPVNALVAVFGAYAVGPHALGILAMLVVVISIDTRIAMVPLVANALRLGDRQKVKAGGLASWMAIAMIASVVIALPVTIWLVYDRGVAGMDSGGTQWALTVANMPVEFLQRNVDQLDSMGQLKAAASGTHLASLQTQKHFFTAAGIGLGLVVACSFLRLRFPRWPLHPLMFLVWGTPWMTEYAPSFLLAWVLKGLIMKYGGQKSYLKARPFFIGLVAGEFAAAMLWAVVGVVYYLQTGVRGKEFLTRP